MPEPNKDDKKLSLRPLKFEEALKGLLETEPPKETQEKKATSKRRQKKSSKQAEKEIKQESGVFDCCTLA